MPGFPAPSRCKARGSIQAQGPMSRSDCDHAIAALCLLRRCAAPGMQVRRRLCTCRHRARTHPWRSRRCRRAADHRGGLDRQDQHLLVRRGRKCLERLDIFLGDEIVDRLRRRRRRSPRDTISVALASASARRSRASASRKAASWRPSASRICACFAPSACRISRLPLAFGFEDLGALLALGLHLPAHRLDQVARRVDVLDLDAGDLDAPRRRPPHRRRAAAGR